MITIEQVKEILVSIIKDAEIGETYYSKLYNEAREPLAIEQARQGIYGAISRKMALNDVLHKIQDLENGE